MAGAGFKDFQAGEVLTAVDVDTYLMQQTVMVFASTAARGSAIGTPTEGMFSYLKDTDALEYYTQAHPGSLSARVAAALKLISY